MTVDQKFLRDVQAAGWQIKAADQSKVVAGCPRAGCALKILLRPDAPVPDTCKPGPDLAEVTVRTYEDARVFLRARREALNLTIKELEEVAGASVDHLAKAEKNNPSKLPNAQLLVEWAASLGYEVVLRPASLPPMALRYISDTRQHVASRVKMRPHHHQRRASPPEQ